MRKNFKILIRKGNVHILKYSVGLFGPTWETIATFSGTCEEDCKRIVSLLNRCDTVTNKDNDYD